MVQAAMSALDVEIMYKLVPTNATTIIKFTADVEVDDSSIDSVVARLQTYAATGANWLLSADSQL